MKFRTPYNYDTNAASVETALFCSEPTRTKQEFADECDINTIVKRFGLGGELPFSARAPIEVDGRFIDPIQFEQAMDMVVAGRRAFEDLPAHVRERFDNSPSKLLRFMDEPRNRAEAIALGILEPPAPERVVDPPVGGGGGSPPPDASKGA